MDDQDSGGNRPGPWLATRARGGQQARDPRDMTAAELAASGCVRRAPLATVRATCLHCLGSRLSVRNCKDIACPSWSLRMGSNPWRRGVKPMSPEQKTARAAALAEARKFRHKTVIEGD